MIISIGNQHFIACNYIVEILAWEGSEAARIKRKAAERGMLINATVARKIKSIIKLKSKHVALSSLEVEIVKSRLKKLAFSRYRPKS